MATVKDNTADELKKVATEMLVASVSDLRDERLVTALMKIQLAEQAIQGLKRLIDEGRLSANKRTAAP